MVLLVCFALGGNHKAHCMIHAFVGYIKNILSRLQLQFRSFECSRRLIKLYGCRFLCKSGEARCHSQQHKHTCYYFLHMKWGFEYINEC